MNGLKNGNRDTSRLASDKGQASVVALVWVIIAGVLAIVVARVGVVSIHRAKAQHVAELAALAGAAGTDGDAREVVILNGGTILEIDRKSSVINVKVAIGGEVGFAAAQRLIVSAP